MGVLVGGWLGREDRGDKVAVACGSAGDALGKSLGAVGWFEGDELDTEGDELDAVGWFVGEALGTQLGGGLNVALTLGLKLGVVAFTIAPW